MSNAQAPLTREALYELIWSEPVTQVAARYGISDRGLGKLCARHSIPVPPRGHWAKKAHGYKVTRTPLPPSKDKNLAQLIVLGAEPLQKPGPQPAPPLALEIAFERMPENRILVPQRLGKLHPLVDRTRERLKEIRPTHWSRGLIFAAEGLDIRVAPSSIPRAMRIMQALIGALEQRGYAVSLSKTERRGIVASMLGEEVVIHLRERTKQILTGKDYPRYDLVPTGVLSFEIGDWYPRPVLTDGAKTKLEERLNDLVVRMLEDALESRQRRELHERREVERREQERVRALEEEKRRVETEKVEQWDAWMAGWRRSREVRAFARAIRSTAGVVEVGSNVETWLAWAEGYADSLDPLRELRAKREATL